MTIIHVSSILCNEAKIQTELDALWTAFSCFLSWSSNFTAWDYFQIPFNSIFKFLTYNQARVLEGLFSQSGTQVMAAWLGKRILQWYRREMMKGWIKELMERWILEDKLESYLKDKIILLKDKLDVWTFQRQ